MALQNYLDIPVLIEYVDATTSSFVPRQVKLPESASLKDIFVKLLFVPGHYEILYEWFRPYLSILPRKIKFILDAPSEYAVKYNLIKLNIKFNLN